MARRAPPGSAATCSAGVQAVIVLLGINDILYPSFATPACGAAHEVTAAQLIQGHQQLIHAAHKRGITVIGATITPFKGAYGGAADNEHSERERIRDEVNHWIRTSGEYDAVVDLDRTLADPADPDAMLPRYAAPDRLHPNDAGMNAIAAAIDLRLLGQ
jgi:lysophospholipase L1-like esterase